MDVEVTQPGYAKDLGSFLRGCGLLCRPHAYGGILHVHYPPAKTDRDTRIVITRALSEWMRFKPQAEAHLIEYRD